MVGLRSRFFCSPLAPRPSPLAFTLIEMLTTVAILVIILGLMVSLARYVRNRSATGLTREVLASLNDGMAGYRKSHGGAAPTICPTKRRCCARPRRTTATSSPPCRQT